MRQCETSGGILRQYFFRFLVASALLLLNQIKSLANQFVILVSIDFAGSRICCQDSFALGLEDQNRIERVLKSRR